MNTYSYIWITNFNNEKKLLLENQLNLFRIVWFNLESLLIDSVKDILQEAYISEKEPKYIVIESKKIPPISQNALLKILEEPPKNIFFILIVPSKSILLPTILSRLIIKIDKTKKDNREVVINPINLNKLNLVSLKNYLNQLKGIPSNKLLITLEQTLFINQNYNFSEYDLERFSLATKLLNLNTNGVRVFLMLLLPFIIRK